MCCGLEIQTGNALLSQHSFPAFEASALGRVEYLLSWLSLAAAILGSIVSGLTWFAVSHRESELAKLELSSQGSGCAFTLQSGIDAYLRRVVGLRALFDSSDHVGRGQFDKFTKQLLSGQSAILGMSW